MDDHSSIKMPPDEVNDENEGQVLRNLYGHTWSANKLAKRGRRKDKFKEGQQVRISNLKGPFKKGYWGNWTDEVFLVGTVQVRALYNVYRLKDWNGEEITGAFYEQEVQGVRTDMEVEDLVLLDEGNHQQGKS
jgi:hypothetical protein